MTTPIENSKIEYNKVQVPNYEGAEVQYLNSAFAAPQNYAVQNGNSVGEMLASGEVNQAENVAEANATEQVEEQNNQKSTEDSNPLFLTDSDIKEIEQAIINKFNEYDKDIQKQILKGYGASDIQELIEKINVRSVLSEIADGDSNEGYKGLKELLGDNYNEENVSKIFSKEYFIRTLPDTVLFWNLNASGHYLDNLNEAAAKVDILSDDFAKIYHEKELDCRYGIYLSSDNTSEINAKLKVHNINDLESQKQIELISKYFEKVIENYQKADLDEKKKLIYNELSPFIAWSKSNNVDESVKEVIDNIAAKMDALKVKFDVAENNDEKIKILENLTIDTIKECSKETLEFLGQQFEENGVLYDYVKDSGIDPNSLKAIFEKCKSPEDFDNLSPEEKELLNKATEVINLAAKVYEGILQNENVTDEDKQRMGENVGDFIGTEMGEESYRTWIEDIHEWYQENGESLNLTPEKFEELMNGATHGNYNTVVEDILRGDGVQTPLNMPETTGSSSYNNSGSSAINPETGFFNTQPQSVIYNSQNSLAELRKSIVESSALDTTPQLVKNNSAQSIIQTGGDKKVSLLTKYRQKVGNLSFVKEIFNNKVNLRDVLAVNMALNSFENMGKSMKLLTFERISNTSGALLATEALSTKEKSEVHAQNIYIAESLAQQIEDEKKKQQGCV